MCVFENSSFVVHFTLDQQEYFSGHPVGSTLNDEISESKKLLVLLSKTFLTLFSMGYF